MHNSKSGTRPKTAREIGIMQGFPPPPEKRPSLENWDLAPFNRWTFQNMRSLFPTVDVRPGPDTRELKQAHRDLLEIEFQTFDDRPLSVATWLTESYTDGFLVLKGDQIFTEIYANDFTPDAAHLG